MLDKELLDNKSSSDLSVTFLGVGDASQQNLGHASIVVERALLDENNHGKRADLKSRAENLESKCESKKLLVDCGPGVLKAFIERYDKLPDALFITHCHLDHIADFEKLFIRSWFFNDVPGAQKFRPKVFVPAKIIPLLHERIGTYPMALADESVNFWDAFQLIPVGDSFEYQGLTYKVYPVMHHGIGSAYCLYLPNTFFYSGDTRPIRDLLVNRISSKARIFHDCSVIGNPSHTGIEDILREYPKGILERLHVYHYNKKSDQAIFVENGLNVIEPNEVFYFSIQSQ